MVIQRFKYGLFFLCFILSAGFLAAQNPAHYRINDARGLPHSTVYSILQSTDGMMWLGTNGGLYRYNSRVFSKYTSSIQKGKALSYLCEDAQGRVWCSNFSGQIFYTQNDSLVVFDDWSAFQKDGWASIAIDHSGRYLAVNGSGLLVLFDLQEHDSKVVSSSAMRATSPFFSKDGDLFFTDERGLGIVLVHELAKGMAQIAANFSVDTKLMTNATSHDICMVQRDESNFCIQERNRAWKLCHDGWNDLQIFTASVIQDNKLYVATSAGLQVWNREGEEWKYGTTWFESDKTNDFIVDRNGNIWISTLNDGIIVVNNTHAFQLSSQFVTLLPDARGTWIASTNTGELQWLDKDLNSTKKKVSLPIRGEVEWMMRDAYSNKILFAQSGTTYQLDHAGHISEHPFMTKGYKRIIFPGNHVYAAATAFNALLVYETKTACDSLFGFAFEKQLYRNKSICQCQLYPDRATDILFDNASNTFWLLTPDGLFFNRKGELHRFDYCEPITAIAKEGNQIMAVSRFGTLLSIDANSGSYNLVQFQGEKPISANMLLIHAKEFILNGENGITRINKLTRKVDVFNAAKGLISTEINQMHLVQDTLFVMTRKGIQFQSLLAYDVVDVFYPPQVLISKIADTSGNDYASNDVVLSPGVSSLDIHLECANWSRPGDFVYLYTIQGLDSRWIEVNASADRISLAFLPPGQYTFIIKAVSPFEGSGQEVVIPIRVLEFWYQTWWFKLISSLIGVVLLLFFFLWQLRRVRKRNERERAMSRLALQKAELESALQISKLNSIKAQMNPHFIFNALNSIQEMIFRDDKFSSSEYLGKFADLMRVILSFSNREFVSLKEEMEMLRLYLELEGLRFGKSFSFELDSDIEDEEDIYIPPMVIQPFAENAMKHGLLHKKNDRRLRIHFCLIHSNRIEVRIDDNGVGRDYVEMIKANRKTTHNSFASGATAERLNLFAAQFGREVGVDIIDKKEGLVALGTCVILRIPVMNQD